MRRSLFLARFFGIRVNAPRAWLVVLTLGVFTLSAYVPTWIPSLAPLETLAVAMVLVIGVLASFVAHEVVHAVALRASGVRVRRVTMDVAGTGTTDAPAVAGKAEIIAAVVAFAFSLLLGELLLSFATLLAGHVPEGVADMERVGPGLAIVMGLSFANFSIGAMHALPAYPLDGGRIFRALAWRLTGDITTATRWSAWVGQGVGALAIASGVLYAWSGNGALPGAWLAFFGWFLAAASARAHLSLVAEDTLASTAVSSMMRRRLVAVSSGTSVAVAMRGWLAQGSEGVVAVLDGDRFCGVVSSRSIEAISPDAWRDTHIGSIATRDEHLVLSPTEDVSKALAKMDEADVDRLPVASGMRLLGSLERADIAAWIASHGTAVLQHHRRVHATA